MRIALALCIGYLLGSVLPADLFADARGIDIRAVGTRNPGATNALRELGLVAGLLTVAYDCSVGLIAMEFAWWLGLSVVWVYSAGLAAVVGHVFPLFFGFRGGQGMAASTGMLLYGIGIALLTRVLSVWGVALLCAVALVGFALTRSASVAGTLAVPLLLAQLLLGGSEWQLATFMTALCAWIWVVQLSLVRSGHLWRLAEPAHAQVARLRSRPH